LALDWDFKVAIFLDIEYLRNDTTAIVTIEQWEVISSVSNGDIFNDLHGPLARFQGHDIFEVEFLKK